MATHRRRSERRNTYPNPADKKYDLFGGWKRRGGDRRRSTRDDRDDRKRRGGRKMSRKRR